jgi:hypothetical protein
MKLKMIMFQVHLWFGLAMAIYLLFPLIAVWVRGKSPSEQSSTLSFLQWTNRIGQFVLLIQFLTGGMIMTNAKYTVWWMITITVLLVVIGAFTGMMAKPLKQWIMAAKEGNENVASASKVIIFASLNALTYAAIIYFMYHPAYAI